VNQAGVTVQHPEYRGPQLEARYCREPVLAFAGDRVHVDPKTGIARFGPASLGRPRHPATIRLAYVGTGESIASAQDWFRRTRQGVAGDPENKLPEFPGFMSDRGYFTELVDSDGLLATIRTHELKDLTKIKKVAPRFDAAVKLISEHVRLLTQQDEKPDVIVLALPDEIMALTKRVKFTDPERGLTYRNLRRALKAELMRHKVPTQILLTQTSEAEPGDRQVDHLSRVAWNLYTSMFYKGGGVPWKPVGLRPDTCYIGVSFHRPLGATDNTLRTSVAQAFDEHGTGLVLRGPDFQWDTWRHGPSPHLPAGSAKALIELVLRRYWSETHHDPARVVVHKTSRFWDEEREGFQDALASVAEFDLVAVSPTSEIRLVRAGSYPPLRGTLFEVGDVSYLYTTGYIPALRAYPHGHVPAPLQIADHHGDSSIDALAAGILVLTKMNWNWAGFAGALPITIRFSRLVGDIMKEIPADREPEPQFKFYT
jgi:hypothetical protein